MSTLYNRKPKARLMRFNEELREPYDSGGRPWGGFRRRDGEGRLHGLHRHPRSRERDARLRLKRHRRARWQRVLGRVRHEGGVWARVRGWITGQHTQRGE